MRFPRLAVPVGDEVVVCLTLRIFFDRHVLRTCRAPLHEHRFAVLDRLLRHALTERDDGIPIEFVVLKRTLFGLSIHRQCLPERVARDDDDGDNAVARGRARGVAVP